MKERLDIGIAADKRHVIAIVDAGIGRHRHLERDNPIRESLLRVVELLIFEPLANNLSIFLYCHISSPSIE